MFFVVMRRQGPSWDPARPLEDQIGWDEHAAFMDRLVDTGFVVLGGPLADEERLVLAVENPPAQQLAQRRAAGLARAHHFVAFVLQRGAQRAPVDLPRHPAGHPARRRATRPGTRRCRPRSR